jgi:hypothetical protein
MLIRRVLLLLLVSSAGCGAFDPLAKERANHDRIMAAFKKDIQSFESAGTSFKAAYERSHAKIEQEENLSKKEVDDVLYDPRFNRLTRFLLATDAELERQKKLGVDIGEATKWIGVEVAKKQGVKKSEMQTLMGDKRFNDYASRYMLLHLAPGHEKYKDVADRER